MCYRHHKETDDTIKYPVEKLKEIKDKHESRFSEKTMTVIPNMIKQIEIEMTYYWNKLIQLKKDDETGLMIEIDTTSKVEEIIEDINSYLDYLLEALGSLSNSNDNLYNEVLILFDKLNLSKEKLDTIPYYENPLINRDWELLNLGTFNAISVIKLRLKQLELKYTEKIVKYNIENTGAKHQLDTLKLQLEELVQQIGFRD